MASLLQGQFFFCVSRGYIYLFILFIYLFIFLFSLKKLNFKQANVPNLVAFRLQVSSIYMPTSVTACFGYKPPPANNLLGLDTPSGYKPQRAAKYNHYRGPMYVLKFWLIGSRHKSHLPGIPTRAHGKCRYESFP